MERADGGLTPPAVPGPAPPQAPAPEGPKPPKYVARYDYDEARRQYRFWWPTAANSGRWIPVVGSSHDHPRYLEKIRRHLLRYYVLPNDPRATPQDLALEPWGPRELAAIEPVGESHVIDLRPAEDREEDVVGPAELERPPEGKPRKEARW